MFESRDEITEGEVRFKIEQAFALAPSMTLSMLNAYLNARMPTQIRTRVLEGMVKDGLVRVEVRLVTSFYGQTNQVKVLHWVGDKPR